MQDGPLSTTATTSTSRIIIYDRPTGLREAEYLYVVDKAQDLPNPAGSAANNGLSEMLAINDTQFLMVEGSFSVGAPGRGDNIRMYLADLTGATDVQNVDSLVGASYTPLSKTLLLTMPAGGAISPDNIEGITFGPTLADGSQSFVLVSDNNFSGTQVTQLILVAVPEPGTLGVLSAASIGLLVRRRAKGGSLPR